VRAKVENYFSYHRLKRVVYEASFDQVRLVEGGHLLLVRRPFVDPPQVLFLDRKTRKVKKDTGTTTSDIHHRPTFFSIPWLAYSIAAVPEPKLATTNNDPMSTPTFLSSS